MTLILEDQREMPCSHCAQMRKTFIMLAISAILPIIVFSAVLLLLASEKMDSKLENITAVIVEFVLCLLYVQLFVAASIFIFSFFKRRHPIMKYHYLYLIFHVFSMTLFLVSSLVMTLANNANVLSAFVLFAGIIYFCLLYYFLRIKKIGGIIVRLSF